MDVSFIAQGFESESINSVGNILQSKLDDNRYTRFFFISAFASSFAMDFLEERIKVNHYRSHKNYTVIVGVDHQGTSKEALEKLNNLHIQTDTMHRVSVNEGVNIRAFVASYYNSISLAFSEICGRSHGGGVLELMPNEVEDIPLPYNEANESLISEIDSWLRAKKPISELLDHTNSIILKEHYNIGDSEIKMANSIWEKLQKRRLGRGGKV